MLKIKYYFTSKNEKNASSGCLCYKVKVQLKLFSLRCCSDTYPPDDRGLRCYQLQTPQGRPLFPAVHYRSQ